MSSYSPVVRTTLTPWLAKFSNAVGPVGSNAFEQAVVEVLVGLQVQVALDVLVDPDRQRVDRPDLDHAVLDARETQRQRGVAVQDGSQPGDVRTAVESWMVMLRRRPGSWWIGRSAACHQPAEWEVLGGDRGVDRS